jgi:hypothetical protein
MSAATVVSTDKQFTGHQRDAELYFMQSRFPRPCSGQAYDPMIGRFLQPDSKACPERSRRMPATMDPQSLDLRHQAKPR